MKKIALFVTLIFLVGCANKGDVDSYKPLSTKESSSKITWYEKLGSSELNSLVEKALLNNNEIKKAIFNIESSYAKVGIESANKLPTLSANYSAQTSRDITKSDNFKENYSFGLNLSYEIDLFAKIKNQTASASSELKATIFDLQDLRAFIVSKVTQSYLSLVFLNYKDKVLRQNLQNYEKIERIQTLKFSEGNIDNLALLASHQKLLALQNELLANKNEIAKSKEALFKLIGEEVELDLSLNLESLHFLEPNLSINLSSLQNRADIKAVIERLNSSFYGYRASNGEFFPNITIMGALNSNSDEFKDSFGLDFLSGIFRLNLPFLDYKRVKNRVKVGEVAFKQAKNGYEKALFEALIEMKFLKSQDEVGKKLYKNSLISLQNSTKELDGYKRRYESGKSQPTDYLEALNKNSLDKLSTLSVKMNALGYEILLIKASGKLD